MLIPFWKKDLTKWLTYIESRVTTIFRLRISSPTCLTHNLFNCLLVSLSVSSSLPHLLYKSFFHFVFPPNCSQLCKVWRALRHPELNTEKVNLPSPTPPLVIHPVPGVRVYLGGWVKAHHLHSLLAYNFVHSLVQLTFVGIYDMWTQF